MENEQQEQEEQKEQQTSPETVVTGKTNPKKDAEEGGQDGDDRSLSKYPQELQKYVKGLRDESKNSRLELKSLKEKLELMENGLKQALGKEDVSEVKPEELIHALANKNEELEVKNALLNIARENNIPEERMDYLQYLMNQALATLPEGEELPEEAYEKIIREVQSLSPQNDQKQNATSSVTGQMPDNNQGGDSLDYAGFKRMNIVERQKLFEDNRPLYEQFKAEAMEKREFVL